MSKTQTTARQWRSRGNRLVFTAVVLALAALTAFQAGNLAPDAPWRTPLLVFAAVVFAAETGLVLWAVRCYSQAARAE